MLNCTRCKSIISITRSCLQREGCGEALVPRGDDPALRGQPQDQAGAGGGGALPHRHQGGLRPRGASHPHHQVRARGDHPCPPRGVRAPLLVIAAIYMYCFMY